ncbi:MAG: hypothetical protein ABW221_08310 [Vicinamibacteria bacterium]
MMRAFCLLVVMSFATDAAAQQLHGEPCPFGLHDPQLAFDEIEGELQPSMMDQPTSQGPLPCGLAVPIDGKAGWVGVNVGTLPRHLVATVELDVSELDLEAGETIEILQVFFPTGVPLPGMAVIPTASVSLGGSKMSFTWRNGLVTEAGSIEVPAPRFTLVLTVDRGRPDTGASLGLSFPGHPDAGMKLGPVDLVGVAIAAQPAVAKVRFGVRATSPAQFNGERGRLRFRPISVESGWGRP